MKEYIMTLDEILAYAKVSYPIGTQIYPPNNAKNSKRIYTINDDLSNPLKNNWLTKDYLIVYNKETPSTGVYLYYQKKWATIVSQSSTEIEMWM